MYAYDNTVFILKPGQPGLVLYLVWPSTVHSLTLLEPGQDIEYRTSINIGKSSTKLPSRAKVTPLYSTSVILSSLASGYNAMSRLLLMLPAAKVGMGGVKSNNYYYILLMVFVAANLHREKF